MLHTNHHLPISHRCHGNQLVPPEDDLPPTPLVFTPHPSNSLMRNRSIDARRRAPSTNTLLLPIISSDDVSVLKALDIPQPRLKQRPHHAGKACEQVSTRSSRLHTHKGGYKELTKRGT